MTQCGLWMDGKWVKTPLTPLERNQVKWGSSGTYLSGGGYAVNSATSHYEISAQWMGTQDELDPIIESLEHGEDFHLVDPFARKNILPEWLANPWFMSKDAPSFTTTRPAGASNRRGAEFDSAGTKTFTVSVPDSSDVPIPNPPVVVATNTYPTPSFELAGDSFVLATNLCPNPTAVVGGAAIGSPAQTAILERGVTLPEPTPNGTTTGWCLSRTDGAATAASIYPDGIGATASTVSNMVYANTAFEYRYESVGGVSGWTAVPAGTWVQTAPYSMSASARYLVFRRSSLAPIDPADRFYYTEIRSGTAANHPFFLPGTNDNPDLTAAWTGTPNDSPSTLSGVRVFGVDGVGHQSTQWASTGTHSLRLLDGEYADIGTGPLQFKARATGQVYTVDSVPHIAVEGVNRVESGLVSLGPGWWDDVSTSETWFYPGVTPLAEWTGTPDNSPSTLGVSTSTGSAAAFLFEGTASITVNGAPAVSGVPLPVPTGDVTIALTGGGTIDYMVLSTLGLPTGRVRGRGYSKVKCTGWTVTGYTAAEEIERIGLSATFVEVGGWN